MLKEIQLTLSSCVMRQQQNDFNFQCGIVFASLATPTVPVASCAYYPSVTAICAI